MLQRSCKLKEIHFLKKKFFFVNNFCYNQVRAIILEPLCFSRQAGSNDKSFDPVRPTLKFALSAYMVSSDPDDPGDLRNILHLGHQEHPRRKGL